MTGPEHYAEAERLLRESDTQDPTPFHQYCATAAQVHATLALAAATAEAATDPASGRPLAMRPIAEGAGDPAYPGNAWGRAIHGEATR